MSSRRLSTTPSLDRSSDSRKIDEALRRIDALERVAPPTIPGLPSAYGFVRYPPVVFDFQREFFQSLTDTSADYMRDPDGAFFYDALTWDNEETPRPGGERSPFWTVWHTNDPEIWSGGSGFIPPDTSCELEQMSAQGDTGVEMPNAQYPQALQYDGYDIKIDWVNDPDVLLTIKRASLWKFSISFTQSWAVEIDEMSAVVWPQPFSVYVGAPNVATHFQQDCARFIADPEQAFSLGGSPHYFQQTQIEGLMHSSTGVDQDIRLHFWTDMGRFEVFLVKGMFVKLADCESHDVTVVVEEPAS